MAIATEVYPQASTKSCKKQYRSHITIITDILSAVSEAGREGAIISSMARSTNLSHYKAVAICKDLVEAGLVESRFVEKSQVYTITGKGREIFQQIQGFIELAKSFGIIV